MALAEPPVRIKRIPMTVEQFERLREGPPYFDYIDGEAIEVNKPTGRHQRIQMLMTHALFQHTRANQLGECFHDIDVRLPMGNWVGPDIVFIASEHIQRYSEEQGDLHGAPDLAVEITSPSTASYDRIEKLEQYRLSEVPWVWIVDQESLAIEEFRWMPEGYLRTAAVAAGTPFAPALFPGLSLDVKALLEPPA